MFKETKSGRTYFCTHRDDHDVTKCNVCLLRNKAERACACKGPRQRNAALCDACYNALFLTNSEESSNKLSATKLTAFEEGVMNEFETLWRQEIKVSGNDGTFPLYRLNVGIHSFESFILSALRSQREKLREEIKNMKVKVEHTTECLATKEGDSYCDCSDYISTLSKNWTLDEVINNLLQ